MKKMRKMMATLVALTLALSTMSISVLAAEKADIEGGGDYLVGVKRDGTLVFSGSFSFVDQ